MTHPEHELLTGLLDEQLTDRELRSVEEHLDECVACANVLTDLRATRALLRGLPYPEMSQLHRKQLWREVNRARRAPANLWRALVAVGGTAAAIAAFVGVTMLGTNKDASILANDVTLERVEANFTATDLELWAVADAAVPGPLEVATAPSDAMAIPSTAAPLGSPSEVATEGRAATANDGAQIARCEERIKPGGGNGARALRYVVGLFEGTPAYLLAYETPADEPTAIEIYAVAIDDCRVLFRATK